MKNVRCYDAITSQCGAYGKCNILLPLPIVQHFKILLNLLKLDNYWTDVVEENSVTTSAAKYSRNPAEIDKIYPYLLKGMKM